jgi:hypothetical protein
MARLYEDDRIVCDDDGITVRQYFFPYGDKRIHWTDIKGVTELAMKGWDSGKYRFWGSGDFRHWFNFDPKRPKKDVAFVVDKGQFVRAVLTPDDPARFRDVLAEKGVALSKG